MSTLKFVEGVKGFTWDYESGEVIAIFTEELSAKEMELVIKASGDVCVIFTEEDINNVFEGSWESQLANLRFEISSAQVPETHVLDTASHEFANAPREKGNIFNFVRKRVQDLPVNNDLLGRPL